jgi:hypothetical protein
MNGRGATSHLADIGLDTHMRFNEFEEAQFAWHDEP